MATLVPPQTVVTAADAGNALAADGLAALGLAVPSLSTAWASAGAAQPGYDPDQLTMTLAGPRAPFRGILSFYSFAPDYSGVDGKCLPGPVAVLELHAEAARRLEKLVDAAHGDAARAMPVPVAMVIHGVAPPDKPVAPNWFVAGEPLVVNNGDTPLPALTSSGGTSATVSFHDARGLPIDPVAVAAMFEHLLALYPALGATDPGTPALGTAFIGLSAIAAIQPGDRIQVIDPHGWPFASDTVSLQVGASGTSAVPSANGLADFASGATLTRVAGDDAARPVRIGWARSGTMSASPLSRPAEPAQSWTAGRRRFFRAMAVDLSWHLLGNRTTQPSRGVPADDGTSIPSVLPAVRTELPGFDYLSDAMDVLGAIGEAAAQFEANGPTAGGVRAILVSPELDQTLAMPPLPRAPGRWPLFPAIPAGGAPFVLGRLAVAGKLQAYRVPSAPQDVIVAIDADAFPATAGATIGPHVRIHPRLFVEIVSIEPGVPSFLRGDGAAALVVPGARTAVLLSNPLALHAGQTLPDTITVDLVATDHAGTRRIASAQTLQIKTLPETDPPVPGGLAQFGGAAALAATFLQTAAIGTRAIAPSGLFGVPAPGGAPAPFLKALLSETSPRQGPRLPTQMRFETIVAFGQQAGGAGTLAFDTVLTGARLSWESRSRRPDLGDPGNPAGPDIYASGIRCKGALAYDLAFHAMKRALPVAPTGGATLGWAAETAGDNWNPPKADTGGTVAGAMLETVAWGTDSPELSLTAEAGLDPPIAAPPSWLSVANDAPIRARLDREITTARSGQRDALWSLARAFVQARECVYIEGPAFAATAAAGATAKHAIDLLALLRQQMLDNPRLRLIVCLPRFPDFASPAKDNWERAALRARKDAFLSFADAGLGDRVAAFHPAGFPGRPAAIRSTTVIVDDVYALSGTSHLRRRGMTFDGAVDVASMDCALVGGYSRDVALFRRELLAAKLGAEPPATIAQTSPHWIRLATPAGAFDLVADLLAVPGGSIAPIWAGPAGTTTEITTANQIDPDGGPGSDTAGLFTNLL